MGLRAACLDGQEEQDDWNDDQSKSSRNPEHFKSVSEVVVHVIHIGLVGYEDTCGREDLKLHSYFTAGPTPVDFAVPR